MLLCIWIVLLSFIAAHVVTEIFKAVNPLHGFKDLNLNFKFVLIYSGFTKEDGLSFQEATYLFKFSLSDAHPLVSSLISRLDTVKNIFSW